MARTIFVAAPRRRRFDPLNPESPTVVSERDPRHPANPAYGQSAGEIAIDEGHGVAGDPGRVNNENGSPPWEVYPTAAILEAMARRALVEVEAREDTSDLAIGDDDVAGLESLASRQVDALRKAGVESVTDLVARIESADSPMAFLTGMKGIGEATAEGLRRELVARGLIDDIEW